MSNTKAIIWIVGSNATGKTTLSKNLHSLLSGTNVSTPYTTKDAQKKVIASTSIYGLTAHVGIIKNDVQCTGTDGLKNKEQIEMSLNLALKYGGGVAIVDGIMSTGTWADMFLKATDNIFMIELAFQDSNLHLERLAIRRLNKQGIEITESNIEDCLSEFKEKTIDNILRKRINFYNQTQNVKSKIKTLVHIEASLIEEEIALQAYNSFIEYLK